MNYDPMWRVVDAHRRCADELERTLKEVTGEPPEAEEDNIELYEFVRQTLSEARAQLHEMNDREGHSVRRIDAVRCRVIAQRCNRAFIRLGTVGEL